MSEHLYFFKGLEENLPKEDIKPGALYHCVDTGNTYLGKNETEMTLFSTTSGKQNIDGSIVIGNNSIAIGNNSIAIGSNVKAGCKGFYWIETVADEKGIIRGLKLTLKQGEWSNPNDYEDSTYALDQWLPGDAISYKNGTRYVLKSVIDYVANDEDDGYPIVFFTEALPFTTVSEDVNINDKSEFSIINPKKPEAGIVPFAEGAFSVGINNSAAGTASIAMGQANLSAGEWSYTEGHSNTAIGTCSHAEGYNTIAGNGYSHAEGFDSIASGESSHAEGDYTRANGAASHTEGSFTNASGGAAHAEGVETVASGVAAHAEGDLTIASGYASHTEGDFTAASGRGAHAEGGNNVAIGDYAHAEGNLTYAGIKGYYIQNIDIANHKITLSNSIEEIYPSWSVGTPSVSLSSLAIDDEFSITASGYYHWPFAGKIIAIDNNIITYDPNNILETTPKWKQQPADNTIPFVFYITSKPNSGVVHIGIGAHAEGDTSYAAANYSHAEGYYTRAGGQYGHAEGFGTRVGYAGHAEGKNTSAIGLDAHAEGSGTTALGNDSHAEGIDTTALGKRAHIEGKSTQKASELIPNLHANTSQDVVLQTWKNATQKFSLAYGQDSHVEGLDCLTLAINSHTEGKETITIGEGAHAEGHQTIASGDYSHAEGLRTTVVNEGAHIEGTSGIKSPYNVLDDATKNEVLTDWSSRTENMAYRYSQALGVASHVEGTDCLALGSRAHAEGQMTVAYGSDSHAEGKCTKAEGSFSHAEGLRTTASGAQSHAEGSSTIASGENAHAEGVGTKASSKNQHVQGKYNIEDTNNAYAHIVGNGSSIKPSNAYTLDWNGNAEFAGSITANNMILKENYAYGDSFPSDPKNGQIFFFKV